MIDIHTHILPGIDDGAVDWDTALALCRVAADDGIHTLVATPHQHPYGAYSNRNDLILHLARELQQRVRTAGMALTIVPGGEVLASPDIVARIARGSALPTYGGHYLLLEFPQAEVPPYAHQVVFDLMVQGIRPVIAHPERNEGFARHPELLVELVEAGALTQMTAASISSQASPVVRACAALLLVHNLVHCMASDAHSPHRRPAVLSRYVRRLGQVVGDERAQALVCAVPGALVRGETVEVAPPIPFTKQSRREAVHLERQLVAAAGRKRRGFAGWFHLSGRSGR